MGFEYGKTYKVSTLRKVLFGMVTIGLSTGLIGLPIYLLFVTKADPVIVLALSVFTVPLGIFFIYHLIDFLRIKLTISPSEITTKGAYKTQSIRYDEVKGYAYDDSYVYLIPVSNERKPLKLSQHLAHRDEWGVRVGIEFDDLGIKSEYDEQQQMLDDEAYGDNADNLKYNIGEVKRVTRVINFLAAAAAIWLSFKPIFYYELAVALNIFAGLLGLIMVIVYKRKVKIFPGQDSDYPSLFLPMSIPGIVLLLDVMKNYEFIDTSRIWILATIMMLVISVIVLRSSWWEIKAQDNIIGKVIPVIIAPLLIYCFSYASIAIINTAYDQSSPTVYSATLAKKVIHEKSTETPTSFSSCPGNLTGIPQR